MRRRRLAQHALAVAVAATLVTACDTNDGRDMQPPDSVAVWQLQSTTPSTTTTVPVPSEIIPATTAAPTLPSTTQATTTTTSLPDSSTPSSPGSSSPSSDDSSTPSSGDAPGGSSTATASTVAATDVGAAALGFPDLSAEGVVFEGPWQPGGAIDASYTCDGDDAEPLLTWTAPPEGTVELALSVLDEDADDAVHWLVVGLPAEAGSIGGGEPLAVGTEAENYTGATGWAGPCPPNGTHTYRFTLYALDQQFEVPVEAGSDDVLAAIEGSTFGVATFTGTYERA